jgi:hypothetical protein
MPIRAPPVNLLPEPRYKQQLGALSSAERVEANSTTPIPFTDYRARLPPLSSSRARAPARSPGLGIEDDECGMCLLHSRAMCSHDVRNLHLRRQIVHLSVLPASRG